MLVFFTLAGDPPPAVNEAHYLCRLKHFWNPGWCAGDLFLDSAEAHVVFAWSFGWVTRWLSLAATAWTGRLLAWTLLAWAWQRLSWRLVSVRLMSVLSAALWVTLTRQAHLAGEWVVGGVEAKCFAYVFVLLALGELVDRRWNRLWLLLGAASAFHALVGGWCVVVCGGIWLADGRQRAPLASMLPGLIGGGLLSLAGVLPALWLSWNELPEVVTKANQIYVFERLPHHLALLTLPREEAVERFLRHGLLLVALAVLQRETRCVEQTDSSLLASRSSLLTVGRFAWGAVLLAGAGLVIEVVLSNNSVWAARLLRYYWFRLTDIAVPLAAAMYAVWLIAAGLGRRRTWAAWGLAAALLLAGWQVTSTVRARALSPMPPADSHVRDAAAWEDACRWVSENTPTDAVFLTPRLAQSFKWRTGRSEVVTHKDIPQDARSIVEWRRRLENIHYPDGASEPIASLGELGTARIKSLAREYGFDYVLTDRSNRLNLPVVYPNSTNPNPEYVVYALGNRDTEAVR